MVVVELVLVMIGTTVCAMIVVVFVVEPVAKSDFVESLKLIGVTLRLKGAF